MLPSGNFWVSQKHRYLIPEEMLALQGFPIHEMCFGNIDRPKLASLAGNAMSVPVMGACMALVFANCEFRTPEKVKEAKVVRLRDEQARESELRDRELISAKRGMTMNFGDVDPITASMM